MVQASTQNPFGTLVLWGQLAAAHARENPFCVKQHRQLLLQHGEPPRRVDRIKYWQAPELFSEVERAVICLSEALSRPFLPNELERVLGQARMHLNADEIQRLSASVLAVNEWIDAHGQIPVRVLVVEDNLDDQELLSRQLQKTSIGDHVMFITDPRIALQMIQAPESNDFRKHLIAVMLDLHLPHMSGLELLRSIRSVDECKDLAVIIMTTDNSPANIAIAEEFKATAFVEKPITMTSFAKAIAPLFHRPLPPSDRLIVPAI